MKNKTTIVRGALEKAEPNRWLELLSAGYSPKEVKQKLYDYHREINHADFDDISAFRKECKIRLDTYLSYTSQFGEAIMSGGIVQIGGRDYSASVGGLLLPTTAPNLLPVSPPVRSPGPQERADPDCPLVPLPERLDEPVRIPPPFPMTAYRAMVGDG